MEDNKTLFGKLARITQKMQRIRKTGRHPQGYQFATDTDIIESVRDAMADENIAIISNLVSWQVLEGGATQKGAPIFHTVAEFEFVFVCADTGASFACKWVNEALDSSDKGFNKAATAALKYFLMKTFLITTGEPDLHEGDNVQATKKSVGNTTQKAPPPETTKPNPFSGQQPPAQQNSGGEPSEIVKEHWTNLISGVKGHSFNGVKPSGQEIANTINKMNLEGAFAGMSTYQQLLAAVIQRITKHYEKTA